MNFNPRIVYSVLEWYNILSQTAADFRNRVKTDFYQVLVDKEFGLFLFVISYTYWHWELTATCTEDLLQRLSSTWVDFYRSILSVGGTISFFRVDWSCLYFYNAPNVLGIDLINITWYFRYLVCPLSLDSEPFTSYWQRHAVFITWVGISIQHWYSPIFAFGS